MKQTAVRWILLGFLGACSSEERTIAPFPAGASVIPGGEDQAPTDTEKSPPSEAPPTEPPSSIALDFRLVRIRPNKYVGTRRVCNVRFAERPLPVTPEIPRKVVTNRKAPPSIARSSAVARMNIECAATDGSGTWIDLRFSDEAHLPKVIPGSRIEVEVEDAYGGFADHTAAQFVSHLGFGQVPPRNTTPAPEDGFDFTQVRHRPRLLKSEQICRVDFASQLAPIERRGRYVRRYPKEASLRTDVRCLHRAGDSWLDLVVTPDDALETLRLQRGARVAFTILRAEGGHANYPVVRIVPD